MPARKPAGLIRRHDTASEMQERADREESLRPKRDLTARIPVRLEGHEFAGKIWQEIIRTYNQAEAEIVTRFDIHQLIDYCILMEQVDELDRMRKVAYQVWLELSQEHQKLVGEDKSDEADLMGIQVAGAFDAIIKLDTRSERKRALLKQYRETLYLTPRTRAGARPVEKEKEPAKDPMAELLGEITDELNGGE